MAEFKRSRLERKTEDQFTKKTIIMGIFTVLLFVLVVVFGLPFLVRFSVFLGEAKNKNDGSIQENVVPPLAPRLVVPFEATNSSKIKISGFAEANVNVELFKNDESIEETKVSSASDFIFENIILNEGENTFTAVARTDKTGNSEMSKPVIVVYDAKVPELKMSNPSEDSVTVDYADFDVIGKSEKGVSVTINNRVAMVDEEGNFKLKFQLNAGKNDLEVVVRDLAGNETRKKIVITYDI